MNIIKSNTAQLNTEAGLLEKKNAKPVFFQPKLSVNQPNDGYEQEADHMADKVMRITDPSIGGSAFFKPAPSPVQRKCGAGEEDKNLHRKENSGNNVHGGDQLDSYVGSLGSLGQPMPQAGRDFFESRFGADFSNVRLHTDSVAAKSAQSINALAYTSGNHIVFNSGQYSPDSDSGKKLMAHELTHVVQQGNSKANEAVQRAPQDLPGADPEPPVLKFTTPDSRGIMNSTDPSISLEVKIDYLPNNVHLHVFVAAQAGGAYKQGAPLQIIGEPGKGGKYTVTLSPVPSKFFIRFEARSDTTNLNVPGIKGESQLFF
jgi:hypothetical protein